MMQLDEIKTLNECYDIFDSYKPPSSVKKHTEGVAKVSYLIGRKFIENGYEINLKNLVFAALLHDALKVIEIEDYTKKNSKAEIEAKKEYWDMLKAKHNKKDHQIAIYDELKDKFPTIAKIASCHGYKQINSGFDTWEEKILFYADKLVKWDEITSLKKRMDDIHKRYSKLYPDTYENKKYVKFTDQRIFDLEKEIFKITGLSPNELIQLNEIDLKDLTGNL